MTIWAIGSAMLMSLLALWLRSPQCALAAVGLAWVAYVLVARRALRLTGDWLCPATVFIVVSVARYALPLILVAFGAADRVPLFQLMRVGGSDWLYGYMLTELAMLGFLLPWSVALPQGSLPPVRADMFRLPQTLDTAGIVAAAVGLAALVTFVGSNLQLSDAIVSGSFRGIEVQQGTGVFFFLSLALFSGSALLTSRLLFDRKLGPVIGCAPSVIAAASFWVLGSRVRATTPLAVALILLAYRRRISARPRQRTRARSTMRLVLFVFLLVWLFGAGRAYRGDATLGEAPALALRAATDWPTLRESLLIDFGQLHAVAVAAVDLEGGVLGGQTFSHAALWPVSDVLRLPGRSPGIYIVESNFKLGTDKWGLHSGLAADAYLNFGLLPVPIVAAGFGWVTRRVYWRFRRARFSGVLYTLGLIYAVRLFFESVDKWPETLVVMTSLWLLIKWRNPTRRRPPGEVGAAEPVVDAPTDAAPVVTASG